MTRRKGRVCSEPFAELLSKVNCERPCAGLIADRGNNRVRCAYRLWGLVCNVLGPAGPRSRIFAADHSTNLAERLSTFLHPNAQHIKMILRHTTSSLRGVARASRRQARKHELTSQHSVSSPCLQAVRGVSSYNAAVAGLTEQQEEVHPLSNTMWG